MSSRSQKKVDDTHINPIKNGSKMDLKNKSKKKGVKLKFLLKNNVPISRGVYR